MKTLLRLLLLLSFAGSVSAQGFIASYQPRQQIRDPQLRQLQDDWRRGRLIENLTELLDKKFALNHPLVIGLGECGQPNAFYRPDKKVIVLCLELIPELVKRLASDRSIDRNTLQNTGAGALMFILLHEMGHALIDIQGLPVLGREEDAADQIAAYLILEETDVADRAIAGGLFFFTKPKLIPGLFSQRHLSGEHSLDPQRAANLACWAYGKEPRRFVWAMHAARVSQERSYRCGREYEQLSRSVRELLGGAIK